ncbi:hypothetical protein HNR06_001253 [Nocardiopsis arvandica]|uniref:DUF4345 domain-containing protein n=1 Tax=Nocardiopsis sinuspersici TaxID=501010 RepID=A0A7Z0BJR2_9ACTN|nr:hypothetical protein [Nocardiopsis sinuspersici]
MRSLRALQTLIAVLALVVVGTGAMDVALGTAPLPGDTGVGTNVDGDYRFFAGVWLGPGIALFAIVPRVLEHTAVLRAVGGAVFLGGLARTVSVAAAGTPAPFILGLLALEPAAPPVLVLWRRGLVEGVGRAPGT